jgi:hypothetical protein
MKSERKLAQGANEVICIAICEETRVVENNYPVGCNEESETI